MLESATAKRNRRVSLSAYQAEKKSEEKFAPPETTTTRVLIDITNWQPRKQLFVLFT